MWINRYEKSVHDADPATARRIAEALGVPVAFLYAEADTMAEAILILGLLPKPEQRKTVADLGPVWRKCPPAAPARKSGSGVNCAGVASGRTRVSSVRSTSSEARPSLLVVLSFIAESHVGVHESRQGTTESEFGTR